MSEHIQLNATIPEDLAGKRLDQVLAILFSSHSRTRLQEWIKGGKVRVNNKVMRQRDKVLGGENVEIKAMYEPQDAWKAEDIQLQIIHEDESFFILNKPAGLVVHPGAGNPEHTLLNALLYYDPQLNIVARAGIVQRLDKDTSGLMIIARTPETQTYLVNQLQKRKIKREYQAIVAGVMTAGGTIDEPIGRHPKQRTKMAVVANGKPAVTHYRIITKYPAHTHIRIQLESGRTHQIRVHMAYLRYPIVGDPVYSGRPQVPKGVTQEFITAIQSFPRQALHASAIELQHPVTGEPLHFAAPLPDDMQALIDTLTVDANRRK